MGVKGLFYNSVFRKKIIVYKQTHGPLKNMQKHTKIYKKLLYIGSKIHHFS